MTCLISPSALKHLEAIYRLIAEDNPDAAASTIDRLLRAIEQLTSHPRLGHPGRRANTLELVHPPFIIVYRIRRERIEIVAVLHGKRRYE
jgi:toxin ParE1/3/4